jgi:hypothetical protein
VTSLPSVEVPTMAPVPIVTFFFNIDRSFHGWKCVTTMASVLILAKTCSNNFFSSQYCNSGTVITRGHAGCLVFWENAVDTRGLAHKVFFSTMERGGRIKTFFLSGRHVYSADIVTMFVNAVIR